MVEPIARLITDAERARAAQVVAYGMLGPVHRERADEWASLFDATYTHGAFRADGELVGTARWFPTRLATPGEPVGAGAVTSVAVLSTDRRQGHLRRMMAVQLDQILAAGNAVAALVAAEWPIYGHYGYGPATHACGFKVDSTSAVFRTDRVGAVRLVDPEELRPAVQAMHEARWARSPGAITFSDDHWDRAIGPAASFPGRPHEPGKVRGALWHDSDGRLGGAVAYTVEDPWTDNRPDGTVNVQLLVGATPAAERELWRHVCDVDWTTRVAAGCRGLDDPLPYLLTDGRAAVEVDRSDHVWVRILDVPAALGARRTAVAGAVVVEVVDPLGYAAGRWSLDIGPDGAEVLVTDAAADVTLPAAALGAAYLGGTPVARLAEAGWLDEERPGGASRLGALLAAPVAPWSPISF